MPFTLQAVPRTGNVYSYERYRHASREDRGQHLFASFCYGCLEQGVRDLSSRVQAEHADGWKKLLPGVAVGGAELDAERKRAVRAVSEDVDRSTRSIQTACALQIVEYLKRHDGFIDSWPEARVHVPIEGGLASQGHLNHAEHEVATAIDDYLRNEVYFTFAFPSAEEAIPQVAEEVRLEQERRALKSCRMRIPWKPLLISYSLLPAGLLALHTILCGPALLEGLLEGPNALTSLFARYAALPQVVRLALAPVCVLLLGLPALVTLLLYGVYRHVGPTAGLAVGGVMGALAILAILYGARDGLRRRAMAEEHRRAINGLERNENVVMAHRERAEYRFVVLQLAQAMRT
ncbi:MAG: hypothetical protein J6D34_09670 [Atopobiaceae bacterium]|nr:hypothetical protein [Atopobiaceae bacterium]